MKNSVVLIVLLGFLISCEQAKVKEDPIEKENHIDFFKSTKMNDHFRSYISYYKDSHFKTNYTLIFDTDTTVVFSTSLFILKEQVNGYCYMGDDIVTIYDTMAFSNDHIKIELFRTDSILKFPYLENIEGLAPYDPIEIKYNLISEKVVKDFRGLNSPLLIEE